jgi:ubiquinone/menaquinone biosynthesis C-methylase UbiE
VEQGDDLKSKVQQYWDHTPCGSDDIPFPEGTLEFFKVVEQRQDDDMDVTRAFAQFSRYRHKRMLEIGVGAGTDFLQFVRAGAQACGIDLSPHSVALTKKHLTVYGLYGLTLVADAERLPFPADYFDLVYSWGVLHHSPTPPEAIAEIYRVLKPGGQIKVMMYNRRSMTSLGLYVKYALLKGKPLVPFSQLYASYLESPGTKAYTIKELKRLFASFIGLEIRGLWMPSARRQTAELFSLRSLIPSWITKWVANLIPDLLSPWIVIEGEKPGGSECQIRQEEKENG